MSRRFSGSGRTWRRVALATATAVALLVPIASASADIGGPPEPSGRSMETFTQAICGTSDCIELQFGAGESGSTADLCLATLRTALDRTTILEQELGCTSDLGAWRTSGGFLTGVAPTSVELFSDLGTSRVVTVSASVALTGAITPTITMEELTEAGCTTTWTIKERVAATTGTITLNGVAFPSGTDSVSRIRQVKEKTKC